MDIERIRHINAGRAHARTGSGRAIREKCGVTAQEIADMLGVTLTTVLRWEKAESVPRRKAAERWATLLAELQRQTAA